MTELQVIGLLAALLTLCGGVVGIWIRIENRIKLAEKDASTKIEATMGLYRMLNDNLAKHQLHSAETFVTKSGLRETTEQIMSAISDVKSSVNGLNQRLDRVFEDRSGQK